MPHISYSVSHASRNSAEIYVSQTDNRLIDGSVAQGDSEGSVDWTDGTGSHGRDAQLTRQRLNGCGAFRCASDDGATVRFAAVQALAGELGVPAVRAGSVGPVNGPFRIALRDGSIDEPVVRLRDVYFSAIPRRMGD